MTPSEPHTRFARLAAALVCAAALAGCLSVPLSTIWNMRNFGPQDFAALDPAEMRLALMTERGVHFDPGKAQIQFRLRPVDKSECFEGDLHFQALDNDPVKPAGLPAARDGFHWVVMALDDGGRENLKALQSKAKGMRKDDNSVVDVYIDFGELELKSHRPFHVNAWLLMQPAEGYLELLRNVRLKPDDLTPKNESNKPKLNQCARLTQL